MAKPNYCPKIGDWVEFFPIPHMRVVATVLEICDDGTYLLQTQYLWHFGVYRPLFKDAFKLPANWLRPV
jgi:hypothetical protein